MACVDRCILPWVRSLLTTSWVRRPNTALAFRSSTTQLAQPLRQPATLLHSLLKDLSWSIGEYRFAKQKKITACRERLHKILLAGHIPFSPTNRYSPHVDLRGVPRMQRLPPRAMDPVADNDRPYTGMRLKFPRSSHSHPTLTTLPAFFPSDSENAF